MKKNIAFTALCSLLIIYFIIYPKFCMASTISGVTIFFKAVFPSLFPFIIICNILLACDGVTIYSRLFGRFLCAPMKLPSSCSFALVVSILCGYPLGAKYTCDLYEKKIISKEQAERLLNIASNGSPLFVIGTVGAALLSSPILGYLLLVANYISCFIMGIILPSNERFGRTDFLRAETSRPIGNIGGILKESIDGSVKSCLSIGGYITIFFVITDILKNNVLYNLGINSLPISPEYKDVLSGLMLGLIEMTKGCYLVSGNTAPTVLKIALNGFLLGFSGLSIVSQVYSFTYRFPELSIIRYVRRKFLQGVICSFAGTILYLGMNLQGKTVSAFSQGSGSFPQSIIYVSLLLIIPLVLHNIKKLLHVS